MNKLLIISIHLLSLPVFIFSQTINENIPVRVEQGSYEQIYNSNHSPRVNVDCNIVQTHAQVEKFTKKSIVQAVGVYILNGQ